MARYILHIGGDPYAEAAIDADSDAEVFSIALTALATFVRSNFPPPNHIQLKVMDAKMKMIGVLTLCYDLT